MLPGKLLVLRDEGEGGILTPNNEGFITRMMVANVSQMSAVGQALGTASLVCFLPFRLEHHLQDGPVLPPTQG